MGQINEPNERTYNQVVCSIPNLSLKLIQDSHWFESSGLKIEVLPSHADEFTAIKIYAHGMGKTNFQKRLVTTLCLCLTP